MNDGPLLDPRAGDQSDAAARTSPSPAPLAELFTVLQPAINAALWQNDVPVLSELRLSANDSEPLGNVRIDLDCRPPVIQQRCWHVQAVEAGQIRLLTDLEVPLDGKFLNCLTEATRATVTVTARKDEPDGELLAVLQKEIRVLAFNEWGGTGGIPDILAAFVEPNDPAVAKILRLASDQLRALGKCDSLEGYQAATKARLWEQADAIWRAICSLDIRYVNPAPSFEQTGQRIRPPRQIFDERLGTCLDLAALFAACFEHCGLRPVIVTLKGHAFAGFWLAKLDFGTSVADDAPALRNRLALHDVLLFETTLVCGRSRTGFRRACEAGAAHVVPGKDDSFEAVIDIHRARQRRIRPLAAELEPYGIKAEADAQSDGPIQLPAEEPPPLREDAGLDTQSEPKGPMSRLERWRNQLLDLSGRNRLLNLRLGGKQALAIDCPDPAVLEDMLASMRGRPKERPLRFRPWPDLMTGSDPRSVRLHRDRMQEEVDLAFARDALAKRELVVGRDDAALQTALTEIYRTARSAQEEGGTNTLFLTIGALLWRQKDKEARFRAPIILVPVVLERPSIRSGFSLRVHDDETRLNTTLLEMLRQEFSIRLPLLEAQRPPEDEAGLDVESILAAFRTKLRDIPGWEVTEEVALSNLSFTKYLMWKDLADRADALRECELARLLIDGRAPEVRGADRNISPSDDRSSADRDEALAGLVCPLEADSSQLRAVAAAGEGKSFVLIGPPGTGKSQTIANIIANTLSQGRTVLFVAEKRAALEVVQRRMRQIGLGDFCLDLFSAKASKAAVLDQINRAQQISEAFDPQDWENAGAEVRTLRAELNGYVRALHRRGRNGWTSFRAMGCVLRAEAGGVPDIPLSWSNADQHDVGDYQRLVELVEDAAATITRIGDITDSTALSGIDVAEWSPPWQTRLLDAAKLAAGRLATLPALFGAAGQVLTLRNITGGRADFEAIDALAGVLLETDALDSGWALAEGSAAAMGAVRVEGARVLRHRGIRSALSAGWKPTAMALPLRDIRETWEKADKRWALPRALQLRALRRRLATEAVRPLPADCRAELDLLIEQQDIEAAVADTSPALAAALGKLWRGLDTDFDQIERGFEWGRRLRAATAQATSDPTTLLALREHARRLVADGADLLAPTGAVGAALGRARAAWVEARSALQNLAQLCGTDSYKIVDATRADWVDALAERLRGWTAAHPHLRDWCAWRGVSQRCDAYGLSPILRALESSIIVAADAVRVFEANYARWWVGLAVDAAPVLRGFVAARHEKRIERFRALDRRMLGLASRLTRARLAMAIPGKAQRDHDPEYAVLARELAKKQRHLPVRQLAARMPRALRRLTPCLMMSPLSVAQYLPAEAEPFDLVIFDEASQIPTWDAVGAIGRGRQVIVVGDPKQLPPTRFFARQLPDGDGEGVEVEIEDLESILDECRGANVPAIELNWHYRSRHESLIAFSNATYYGGRLVTFPSPVTQDAAVSFRHVRDGVYARGGARTNLIEARAVVAEALARLHENGTTDQEASLGIVTFNAEQQALIENLLDEARRADPSIERFFKEAADDCPEPVLIRNLESVQGEERDVMLFSLTYGPDTSGRIAMNFGPLNQAGGERRLNVAVTRARQSLVVFSSIHPHQIDTARSSSAGVADLKKFLLFAEHGARAFATFDSGSLGDHESPFEAAVAERLRAHGWTVHPQIGVSDFRIDLGVVDPDAPGTFLAGLECDGATYHRGATARDRDRLRQAVLEGLGWRILRIWSTDWWTNAGRETERLHCALESALAAARAERSALVIDAEPKAKVSDATAPETTLVAAEAESFGDGSMTMETTDLGRSESALTPNSARFYEPAYKGVLAGLIAGTLESEGAMRLDRLIQHVARLHGFQRAGREIQERVTMAIPPACVHTEETGGTFIWPTGVGPADCVGFRAPVMGQVRDPSEISLEELTMLAGACLERNPDEEVALSAMRDACGLSRLRETARARCREAIARARPAGRHFD
jgi:very-short-patch-repair endonuclease